MKIAQRGMRRHFLKATSVASLFVVAVVVAITAVPQSASASIFDDWLGNGDVSEGFFHNAGAWDMQAKNRISCGYTRGCPVLPNGDYTDNAIPDYRNGNNSIAQSVANAKALIATLKAYHTSNNGWSQAGSSFIVNTMLGYTSDSPNKVLNVTDAMWAEVELRLVDRANKGKINWNINFSSNGNDTYSKILKYQDGSTHWDIVYNGQSTTRNGLIVYNDNNTPAYKLWYLCANPVGSMSGLPLASYDLTPAITGTPPTSEGSTNVSVTPSVNNAGPSPSTGTEWQVTNFVLDPGEAVPGAADNASLPVAHYGNGAQVISSGTSDFPVTVVNLPLAPQFIGEYPPGTRICFALSIKGYALRVTNWRHGIPFCVLIAKQPKIQVLGSDLIVGKTGSSTVTTLTTTKVIGGTSRTFGSWGEYAATASGIITGFGSGAGYSGGSLSTAFCDASLLTFTSAGGSTCSDSTSKGGYVTSALLPAISERIVTSSSLTSQTVNLQTIPEGAYSGSNDIVVGKGGPAADPMVVAMGKWVVIKAPTATVRITNNISYANGTISELSDIPQVVIIADRILIDPGVTEVDSWLIASGTTGSINTCASVSDPTVSGQLNANTCTNRLTVNGPVAARHLYLYRTAGSGSGMATGDPAEVFNLRPDAYLWATSYTASSGRLQTVYSKELPPRF